MPWHREASNRRKWKVADYFRSRRSVSGRLLLPTERDDGGNWINTG